MAQSLFAGQEPEMILPTEIDDGHASDDESEMPGTSSRGDHYQRAQPPEAKRPRRSDQHGGGRHIASENNSLFGIVRQGRQALQSVVDDWIENYKRDKDSALLELINFLVQCCGCKGIVTNEMFVAMDQTEIIQRVTEEFDEDSGDYPLIQSGPAWKKFKNNFQEFIVVLVRQCQSSLLFDQYLFDNVISLLTGLCDSPVRAFRHTSTLAAMKLMTALVTVATSLNVAHDKISRQYEAERAKNPAKRASGRVEILKNKNDEYEENINEIQQMMGNIFTGIFVHRYRDTVPDIRAVCMGEIGTWIKNYPSMFLDDGYLRYIGWNLHDKHWDVRLKCINALHGVYTSEEFASSLELFTSRFKDRIVSMTLDKKTDVAVQAIKLITCINSYREDALDNQDCESVYQLVFSAHRQVAQAAGQFLNQRLLVRDEEQLKLKKKGLKKFSVNVAPIRDLVQYFIESELHSHAAYLVDSLWDQTAILKDWEGMTSMLLEDSPSGEFEPLTDKEEAHLIDIMTCSLRQASDAQPPVGRAQPKKLTGKEKHQVSEDRRLYTTHFIQALPHLLGKHGIDPDKVANLVLIPQYFDLDIYTSSRLEQHLEPLLKLLTEIVTKHTDKDILSNCAKTFEYLCGETYSISYKCKTALSSLIDNLTATFQAAWQDYVENASEISENEIYNLSASVRRVAAFYSAHNLNSWELYDTLFKIARSSSDNVNVNAPIIADSVGCLQHCLMWAKIDIDDQNPDKNLMKSLKRRIHEVMSLCSELMKFHSDSDVKEEAYINICDLLVYYGKQLGTEKALKPLVYVADRCLQDDLGQFVEQFVFIQEEENADDDDDEAQKIEALHKRRNLLAGFCKLIIFNNISVKAAADIFKHYLRFYNDYGDIIKSTLGKVNENDRVECARVIIRALHILWGSLPRMDRIRIDKATEDFAHIKDLARNFSFIFNLDQLKSREAIEALHREGIVYALTPERNENDPSSPPPNADFLEIVNEFTNKMLKQDRKTTLQYLDSFNIRPGNEDLWAAYLIYRTNLANTESDGRVATQKSTKATQNTVLPTQTQRGRPANNRKRGLDDDYPSTPASSCSSSGFSSVHNTPQNTALSRAERAAARGMLRQEKENVSSQE